MSEHDSQEAAHLAQAANVKITIRMTPRQAFDLILKLSSDDAFRAQVQKDPHKVLAGHGIDVPSRDIPLERALPPKEKLQEVLLQIMARRQGSVSELPFNVDPRDSHSTRDNDVVRGERWRGQGRNSIRRSREIEQELHGESLLVDRRDFQEIDAVHHRVAAGVDCGQNLSPPSQTPAEVLRGHNLNLPRELRCLNLLVCADDILHRYLQRAVEGIHLHRLQLNEVSQHLLQRSLQRELQSRRQFRAVGSKTSCSNPLPKSGRFTRSPGFVNSNCSIMSRMWS